MKKRLLVPVLTLTLLAGSIYGIGQASAQMNWQDNTPVVQRLAERFGLDENEVKEVFTELHEERQMEQQLKFESNLETAFQNGEISAEQKQAILEKHADMMAERQNMDREAFQNMTREEKQAQNEAKRAEMDSWAEENGIELEHFLGGSPQGKMGDRMGKFDGQGR